MEKEYLYIGHYTDTTGNYILKIGTTNDLKRRKREHTTNYRKIKKYKMPIDKEFEYDFCLRLSKYNALRYEDVNRQKWKELGIGEFVRNDRFNCGLHKPQEVYIKIRKIYTVTLN